MPRGLIIFLLFNKYLGIVSVLESKRPGARAGHVAAHIDDIRRLSPNSRHLASDSLTSHSSSCGGANKGSPLKGMPNVSPAVNFSGLLE